MPTVSRARLVQFATNIWIIDQRLRVGGVEMGARSVVVRLPGRGLVVHSPGPDLASLRQELGGLGPVVGLIAPNLVHHRFVSAAHAAFPEARVFTVPGLRARRPELPPGEDLAGAEPELWRGQIDQLSVAGAPKLGEWVFFHRASRTLVLADLAFNIQHASSLFARLFWRLDGAYGRFGGTRLLRSWVKDRAAFVASLRQILAWDFQRVTVGHGAPVERDGHALFRSGFERELSWA